MPRPPDPPTTALGAALRARRGDMSGDDVARLLRIERGTFYRIESGRQLPGLETTVKIAAYLDWTIGQVIDAARRPAPDETSEG